MADWHLAFDPNDLTLVQRYDLLAAGVVPRPIALVGTIGVNGVPNLAPFSFFVPGGSSPMSLVFSPAIARGGARKDTLRNVIDTGEFVVNLVTREMACGMNASSAPVHEDEDEWLLSGFTALPCDVVRPSRVAESPLSFECRLFQIIEHGAEVGAARYVVGEVVRVHCLPEFWNGEGRPETLRAVGRLGTSEYVDLELLERFSMPRPSRPES